MLIQYFPTQLRKRQAKTGLEFELGAPGGEQQIQDLERRLGVVLPSNVRRFYRQHDGLRVEDPPLRILSLRELALVDGRIVFSIFDKVNSIAFVVDGVNIADEWDIVCGETGFLVTLTMASFWSNKIFAWIDRRREIWREEFPSVPCSSS